MRKKNKVGNRLLSYTNPTNALNKVTPRTIQYHTQKEFGQCTYGGCLEQAVDGKSMCQEHLDFKAAKAREFRANK